MQEKDLCVIGIIPRYPKHSQQNIYAGIRMPPVGIASILSQIANQDGFSDVYAIDENNYRGPRDFTDMADHQFLQDRIPADVAMFYGGMSNSIPRLFSLAKQYKRFDSVTIAGGSHVDALPEEALRSGVDIVVHGEGEHTAIELLDIIRSHGLKTGLLENVKGISYLDAGNVVFTGKRQPITDLEQLIDTDLTLIKYLEKRWSAIPVNRGRGCNWNCEFCVVNKQYGRFKALSVEKAMRQVVKHSDMGYKKFFFTDDNFAQDMEGAARLLRMIGDYKREFNKKIRLTIQVRSEVADDEDFIDAMKYGCVKTLAIGYESPIDSELKDMKKGVTVDKLVKRSRRLAEDFHLHGMFIFGYPKFNRQKPEMTIKERAKAYKRFFKKARVDTVQVLNAVPLPGSTLRKKLEDEDRIFPSQMVGWDKYDGQFLCYDPRPEGIDPQDLQDTPRLLMQKWYLGNLGSLNYGNWMNWTYNATVGFLIQFGIFYPRRFARNRRERSMGFQKPLAGAWYDITKKWRNLAIRTYGGSVARKWMEEYRSSGYAEKIKRYLKKANRPNQNI